MSPRRTGTSPPAGIVSNGAVHITKDVHSAIPTAKVFGGDGVCTDSYTNATKGGIPASLYPLTQCTVATGFVAGDAVIRHDLPNLARCPVPPPGAPVRQGS